MGIAISSDRVLTEADNGQVIECTASLSVYVPSGLPEDFACIFLPTAGTVSVISRGGVLLNGATTTVTRAAASNPSFAIFDKPSAANSYVVTGS